MRPPLVRRDAHHERPPALRILRLRRLLRGLLHLSRLDQVSDRDLGAFATRILDKSFERIGYQIGGLHFMLQSFAKTRPADLRAFLKTVMEECT